MNQRAGQSVAMAESRIWRSRTSFVPTRHTKDRRDDRDWLVDGPKYELAMRLEQAGFPEPVRGPICLGYGAHYGLGRFEPVELKAKSKTRKRFSSLLVVKAI